MHIPQRRQRLVTTNGVSLPGVSSIAPNGHSWLQRPHIVHFCKKKLGYERSPTRGCTAAPAAAFSTDWMALSAAAAPSTAAAARSIGFFFLPAPRAGGGGGAEGGGGGRGGLVGEAEEVRARETVARDGQPLALEVLEVEPLGLRGHGHHPRRQDHQ